MSAQERIEAECRALPDVTWSVCIRRGGQVVAEVSADRPLRIASLGKLLVLMAAAERIAEAPAFADLALARPAVPVADSGLWQHLSAPAITVRDACVLVASVSDNLATNALIDAIGLDACHGIAQRLGRASFRLHDVVRDARGPGDPPCLAEGSAADAVGLLSAIDAEPERWGEVRHWLSLGVDHSMALGALGADPLSPGAVGEPPHAHKTGSDPGVRADAGIIGSAQDALVYAVIANADPASPDVPSIPAAMRAILTVALRD